MAHTIDALEAALPTPEMQDLVTEILASSLKSLGLFDHGVHTIAGLASSGPPAPYFERWLATSARYLQEQKVLDDDLAFSREIATTGQLWAQWETKRPLWANNPNLLAQSALLEACLKALPAVLTGTQRPTDVMFPNSSMHLVEGVYRGNIVADHFNEVLGETLIDCIERRLRADGALGIRILEIGAGTGGTTAKVLPMLRRYPVAEYCFTDLSRAFLLYAERRFKQEFPALTTAIFDVSAPLETQAIAANHYDFAIAANVLHATPDIRETVRNAKATLKNQGVLLLNEISTWNLFSHLTFGLLEGWWLHEDTAVRLPGAPGLAPARWREILEDEGFESVLFPAEHAHRFGQQIVSAASDGWTRQRIAADAPLPSTEAIEHRNVEDMNAARRTENSQAPGTAPSTEPTEQMRLDHVRQVITEKLSEALRMDAAIVRGDAPFADYGVDSILGVNLIRSINEALQIELETTSLFEYSTVDQLSQYIQKNWQPQIAAQLARVRGVSQAPVASTDEAPGPSAQHRFAADAALAGAPAPVDSRLNDEFPAIGAVPIAVIGMSGRFAESESLEEFWRNLADGKDLVKKASRWNPSECAMSAGGDQPYCAYGSFVDSIDQFDPAFFGIAPQEAAYMDPQQRLFLEESWKALEHAGYAGAGVHEQQCGVYVGCGSSYYDRLFTGNPPPQAFWGNSESVVPARIAYSLDLHGPAIAVDTACSSSLVAIHLACQGLWSRETDLAVAGGVFLQPTPRFHQVANRARMLSPDGKCYSFDARANGFVPGEGVGVVVLKRLRDALADGDCVHGVIAASGINQDGRSNGLIAPNGRAQERLERSVYDRFQINPETIQVLEAHATGTALGDSIEYGAISRAFRAYTDKKQFCALGTVKTNLGHAAAAAGVAGVLKLLLALEHRQVPPSLHFQSANPAIALESGPFHVNTELRPWDTEGDQVRRAAISAFGFNGTNAHLILDEAPTPEGTSGESPAYLIVLSARTSEQLKRQAHNLLAFVTRAPDLSLNDLSFTLFVGRTHLAHRLSCVARTHDELVHALEQWLETGGAGQICTGTIQEGTVREQASLKKFGNHCIRECATLTDRASYVENLAAIGELYVQGYSLDFHQLFAGGSRRIPLPTYPFARERYWVDTADTRPASLGADVAQLSSPAPSQPSPSVHGDTSNPVRQTRPATFTRLEEDVVARLQDDLLQVAADVLKVSVDGVALDQILTDLGFDSTGLTAFASAINERYGVRITPVVFFDHPSIGDLARHLCVERKDEMTRFYGAPADATTRVATAAPPRSESDAACAPGQQEKGSEVAGDTPATTRDGEAAHRSGARRLSADRRFVDEPIAIVGISGVMPQSDDLEVWWKNLRRSKDLITTIPEDRWRWEDYYGDPFKEPNKSNSKWGGFMNEIDKFDPLFFGISPREAHMMDPQQRIFLETAWKAIEDAGHKTSDLSGTRTGLFVGAGSADYVDVLRNAPIVLDGYSASGNAHSVLANRVSFLLNLRGPSSPIDTACSSSLVAVHRAVESIHTGSCDMAIVGGVQVMLSPVSYVSFAAAGMLSADGKCRTFDRRANGYVRGEGAGAVFLKRLSDAEADGNHIYAVIKATAENHGGRVTTLTAPNSSAQSALIIEAYEKAHIDVATIGYIECHGTGTSLGDPIEFQALNQAFAALAGRSKTPPAATPHCGLGSVKTNIGHLETAAGIAGLLKVLLAIKHKEIPASLNFEEINPYIDLEGTPFYIVDRLTPWKAGTDDKGRPIPRRAGVSSFGFGGSNAHVVVEEYLPPDRAARPNSDGPQVIVLSAKNEDRLRAYVESMRAYLDGNDVDLGDHAYTLQVGRDEMPERLAVVASSASDLKEKLARILEGGATPGDCYRGNIRDGAAKLQACDAGKQAPVGSSIDRSELSRLAERWVAGAKVEWSLLHANDVRRRILLPTYPFARERCWIPGTQGLGADGWLQQHQAETLLHPLIHRNVSTLEEQKFVSRFSGNEFYCADHVVDGQKVLAGVAFLEMARAAGELSGNAKVSVIHNLTVEKPLVVGRDVNELKTTLLPARDAVGFTVSTGAGKSAVTLCRGRLGYDVDIPAPEVLDIAGIRQRCSEQILSGKEVYELLLGAGLRLGSTFHVVQSILAGEGESLAIVQLPDSLRKDSAQFWLHPALVEGALHAAVGLMKKDGPQVPLGVAFSVGEVQILHPLQDLHYVYATWAPGDRSDDPRTRRVVFHLLDETGKVLVRIKDFVSRPIHQDATQPIVRPQEDQATQGVAPEEPEARLQFLAPVWSPVRPQSGTRAVPSDSSTVLLLGSDRTHFEWLRASHPNSQLLESASFSSIDTIEKALDGRSFDELVWIAPDVNSSGATAAGGDERIIDSQQLGVLAVFRATKALLRMGYGNKNLRWTFVTAGTQQVRPGEPVQPAHAGIIGLVGSLAKECPQWDLRLVDLESPASVSASECLALPWDKQGNGLAHRGGEWFQQGFAPVTGTPPPKPVYRQNGVYVVIGGAGGLGEVWSRFMVEHYHANLVWIGRRACDAAIEAKIKSLADIGPAPLYLSADATRLDELEQACQTVLQVHPAIHGVVHSSVVLHDRSIARMDEAGFRASLAAKIDASVNVDRVFGKHELDLVLFFSSIVSFVRSAGQSNYSAGCAFTDSFVHKLRRERGYPVKVMNWGYWGEIGIAAGEAHRKMMARVGLAPIEPREGMEALQTLVNSDMGQAVLVKTIGNQASARLADGSSARRPEPAGTKDTGTAGAASAPARAHTDDVGYVRSIVTEKLCEELRIDAGRIRGDAPLTDYGVDSIVGVNLVRSISEALQIELETTSLFENSTVDQLAEYIVRNWRDRITARPVPTQDAAQTSGDGDSARETGGDVEERAGGKERRPDAGRPLGVGLKSGSRRIGGDPIAVIGMAGRFAQSESLDAFWYNLAQGKDLVREVSRWRPSECVMPESAGQPCCSQGGFIDSIDQFDPAFFGIDARDAASIDPQQRLFLEESWRALEDAGYAGTDLRERQCAVYVGCGSSHYDLLFNGNPPVHALWGNSPSAIPARIAQYLNLRGPAIAVDTACSSSLVAIHVACQSLWSRETDMALAGGVYLQATPGFYRMANGAGALSPDGKCCSFDARANGYVPGEGVGVLVLKRLSDALEDGDHVHGVIAGSGINRGGGGNGVPAPDGAAQEQLERSVYDQFAIDPETIQVVEAHAPGTVLDDSVEFEAITRAFRAYTDKTQFCALGTVKTNIGHTAAAAGIAGVMKILLSLKYRQIPPSLHFREPNPRIDLESGPFYLNGRLKEWAVKEDQTRRAAVSAFGVTGTNAHLVIEEAPPVDRVTVDLPAHVVVLSARSWDQVKRQARELIALVRRSPDVSMLDLSFTLFEGRRHLTHRLACVASDQQELLRALEHWVDTGAASHVYASELQEGRVDERPSLRHFGNHCIQVCRNATSAATYREHLETIADLYVQGYSLDFRSLFPRESRRMALPTYPFARQRCWVGDGDGYTSPATPGDAIDGEKILESVLWNEASRDESYEEVTF